MVYNFSITYEYKKVFCIQIYVTQEFNLLADYSLVKVWYNTLRGQVIVIN